MTKMCSRRLAIQKEIRNEILTKAQSQGSQRDCTGLTGSALTDTGWVHPLETAAHFVWDEAQAFTTIPEDPNPGLGLKGMVCSV